jgi:peptide/nickel transport system permease protein
MDPVYMMFGDVFQATPEQFAQMRHQLGLDQPIYIQYFVYLGNLVRGNFGWSFQSARPVNEDLAQFFPATLELTAFALLFSMLVGVPLGIFSAVKRGKWTDHVMRIFALGGIAAPAFWIGLMLQILFYSYLGILPIGGRADERLLLQYPLQQITGFYTLDSLVTGNWPILFSSIVHLILPGFVLGYRSLALIMRVTRSSMLEIIHSDFVRTARAMGLRERSVILRYALKNSLIPVVTTIGLNYGLLLQGSWLVETVFIFPGIGLYGWKAIQYGNYPGILAVATVSTVVYVIINLVVDILYTVVDPRIKY